MYLISRMQASAKRGVIANVSDIDPKRMPMPAINKKRPVIIGFLE